MFKIKSLTQRLEENLIKEKEVEYQELVKNYYSFLCSIISDTKLQKKLKNIFNNCICYIVDKQTIIPRKLGEKDKSFRTPYRAVAFVREQKCDSKDCEDKLKYGIAVLFNEKNKGIVLHEINHCFSRPIEYVDKEGTLIKLGFNVLKIHDDKNENLTGNAIDEGITDAIAKYYYDTKIKDETDEQKRPYKTAYDSLRVACNILLGKNLSNTMLLNAYFGDLEALNEFIEDFDKTMKSENISFKKILKTSFEYEDCIDGESFTDEQLIYYFSKYQLKKCKNVQQKKELEEWILSQGVNINVKY